MVLTDDRIRFPIADAQPFVRSAWALINIHPIGNGVARMGAAIALAILLVLVAKVLIERPASFLISRNVLVDRFMMKVESRLAF